MHNLINLLISQVTITQTNIWNIPASLKDFGAPPSRCHPKEPPFWLGPSSIMLPVLEQRINGVREWVYFGDWLLWLTVFSVRFLHCMACGILFHGFIVFHLMSIPQPTRIHHMKLLTATFLSPKTPFPKVWPNIYPFYTWRYLLLRTFGCISWEHACAPVPLFLWSIFLGADLVGLRVYIR